MVKKKKGKFSSCGRGWINHAWDETASSTRESLLLLYLVLLALFLLDFNVQTSMGDADEKIEQLIGMLSYVDNVFGCSARVTYP